MGATISLGFIDSDYGGPTLDSKSFFKEILTASYPDYLNHEDFLTSKEQELLYPDYNEYDSNDKYRHIEPAVLKNVFVKVYNYLQNNYDKLPLTHMISEDKRLYSSTSNHFNYKNQECYLDGFHHDFKHRDELCLICLRDNTVEWIKASNKILIEDKVFYIETRNKFQQFKDILQELIEICDEGIKLNKKLIWAFSN